MSSSSPEICTGKNDNSEKSNSLSADETEKKEKRLREIRAQIEQIKKQIEETDGQESTSTGSRKRRSSDDAHDNGEGAKSADPNQQSNHFRRPHETKRRQRETIEKVHQFKDVLKQVSKDAKSSIPNLPKSDQTTPSTSNDLNDEMNEESRLLDLADSDSWLKHRFEAKDEPNSDSDGREVAQSPMRQERSDERRGQKVPSERDRRRERSKSPGRSRHKRHRDRREHRDHRHESSNSNEHYRHRSHRH